MRCRARLRPGEVQRVSRGRRLGGASRLTSWRKRTSMSGTRPEGPAPQPNVGRRPVRWREAPGVGLGDPHQLRLHLVRRHLRVPPVIGGALPVPGAALGNQQHVPRQPSDHFPPTRPVLLVPLVEGVGGGDGFACETLVDEVELNVRDFASAPMFRTRNMGARHRGLKGREGWMRHLKLRRHLKPPHRRAIVTSCFQ